MNEEEYVELLIKTTESCGTTDPVEARKGCLIPGNIVVVRPAGWTWGKEERNPEKFGIVSMLKSQYNKIWIEPEYNYSHPILNEKGEVTEAYSSNIFIKKGKNIFTPPVKCGLLPGTYRQYLLSKRACREKVLYKDDIKNADEVYIGNSVRGLRKVILKCKM